MKRIRSCCWFLAYLVSSVSCAATSFSIHDRWEGWGDDRVRIYVQVSRDYPAAGPGDAGEDAGKEGETPADPAYIRLAMDRAAHLANQYKTAAAFGAPDEKGSRNIDPGSGRVVYKKCDESKCEAFVDFSYAGQGQ